MKIDNISIKSQKQAIYGQVTSKNLLKTLLSVSLEGFRFRGLKIKEIYVALVAVLFMCVN